MSEIPARRYAGAEAGAAATFRPTLELLALVRNHCLTRSAERVGPGPPQQGAAPHRDGTH